MDLTNARPVHPAAAATPLSALSFTEIRTAEAPDETSKPTDM